LLIISSIQREQARNSPFATQVNPPAEPVNHPSMDLRGPAEVMAKDPEELKEKLWDLVADRLAADGCSNFMDLRIFEKHGQKFGIFMKSNSVVVIPMEFDRDPFGHDPEPHRLGHKMSEL
jgi:hypothetical protein